ncbi:MAG TPA: sigma-70 family RNA polymerase sigma factor [Vitreimonas sp.]|uniref:sigma-70 family RNA polymerase sigma factor n=1 Tax=Vitreimonas sp. TaxID=3069702 RepID=UPI002D280357|nr:sigma-70 family RNA polymerase sigma factor [Vitreimonas sp.]HYD86626.1 sigma-70 family RNA polymerase sigma factor [Vitreimonas sp.]
MADEAALRALLLKGLAGEEAAHRAFLTEAAALLRAYFRNRLRGRAEDAEDLVQETLVALHTRRDSYDPNYPLTAWLYAIARYRLIDFLRRAKHRDHAGLDGHDFGEPDPEYDAADAKHDIKVLLDKLPEKQRTAIRMVKLEERSVRETADATGLSESDIKISIHRGLKTLMRLMAGEQAT